MERLALHGLSAGAWQRFTDRGFRHYEAVEPGFKYNMTDVQAASGPAPAAHSSWIERRRGALGALRRAAGGPAARHAPAAGRIAYPARPSPLPGAASDRAPLPRDELLQALHEQNIGTGSPLPRRSICTPTTATGIDWHRPTSRSRPGSLGERSASRWDPALSEADQDDVVQALMELLG